MTTTYNRIHSVSGFAVYERVKDGNPAKYVIAKLPNKKRPDEPPASVTQEFDDCNKAIETLKRWATDLRDTSTGGETK